MEKTYTLFESKHQLKLTLPQSLAQAVGLHKGDRIKYILDKGELTIRKVQL